MLVRLSRAPVLSGGLRRKTQLFSCTLHGRFLQDPTSLVQRSSEVQNPAQVPVFPGSSPLCHHTKREKHQTQLHSTQSWSVTGLRGRKIKIS
ncbi:hypothetical protein TNCV_263431 [Trichonephila clavipes]|nr:hypothetical protein TNCV_263431 [Trichonephila clavipes]